MPGSYALDSDHADLGEVAAGNGIYRLPILERYPQLLHGISTRRSPDGQDWNLSARRGTSHAPPDPQVALANRRKLAAMLAISLDNIVGCQQVHGVEVAPVGPGDKGRGMSADRPSVQGADAMVTDTPGVYLLALSADCPPVFLYDPVRRAIGLAHSGWKGTVGRISANVVGAMSASFGSDPADLVAVVGPGIGACCYSVGPNVIEAAREAFGAVAPRLLEERGGRTFFNLPEAIRVTLLEAGVAARNVHVEQVCTMHNLHIFYSHRGEKGQCGLFGAVLGMREA